MLRNILKFIKEKRAFLLTAAGFIAIGIGLSAAYGTAVQYTNTLGFCANTCHEMHDTVYQEYSHSKHFKNEFGVVVACPQCHVPQNDWVHTMGHKILATFELWDHWTGRVDTKEKFEAHRLELAKKVWADFAATNARECKACHHYANMVLDEQRPSIRAQHRDAMKTDENCLDCHKDTGLTHNRPEEKQSAPLSFDIQ
ncbi:MAG: NapC/NirT family cytochrome c [Alphaproteobacteria bacterium]|nr:NapC/NirT family cytochrome c [Alphaproteobacteria bacterium]